MNTAAMKERIAEASPRLKSSLTAVFYVLTIVAGGVVLFVHGSLGFAVVAACYFALTALFYDLLRPVSKSRSLLAASRNLVGRIAGHSRTVPKQVRRTI
jgi:membrane protein implicated in regulation of membrane protease activity